VRRGSRQVRCLLLRERAITPNRRRPVKGVTPEAIATRMPEMKERAGGAFFSEGSCCEAM
jgi:hypothetical protein